MQLCQPELLALSLTIITAAHSKTPSDRYNIEAFHHPSNGKLNILRAAGEHFLDGNMAAFDAPFFDITSQEAKAMDPTGRLLFEVSYEALENSGLPIESIAGSDPSCYVGCFTRDYYEMMMRDAESAPIVHQNPKISYLNGS